MKTTLHYLLTTILYAGWLTIPAANAQVDYFQNFATDTHNWTTTDFNSTDVATCNDPYAFRAAYKNYADATVPAVTNSPLLGISNGERIVLSYSYKVLLYDDVVPYKSASGNNWGTLTVAYGPTINGPWIVADNVNDKNHIPSSDCVVRKVAFTPANGSNVYLRITAGNGTDYANGYYIYVDNVSLLQDSLTTGPAVADSLLKVYPNPVTDYLTVEYAGGAINNLQIFNNQGEAVSVENIDNNFSRLDLSGLNGGNYTIKVVGDNDEISTVTVEKRQVN